MPNGQSLDTIKIHKVPNLEVWEQNYQTIQNPNGLIEPGDLVSFPPNLLGEVLPDYPDTAGTTFLKAVTTVNGNDTETETSWGESALGDTITIDSAINAQSAGIPSSSAVRNLVNNLDANAVGALPSNTAYVSTFNGSSGPISYTAPVTKVNDKTGNVALDATDVGAISTSEKGAASGVATLDTDTKVEADQTTAKIINSSTDLTFNNNVYSLKATDNGCLIVDRGANGTHTYQIKVSGNAPYNYSIGTEIEIMRYGSGAVIISVESEASLNNATASKTLSDQYTSAVLKCIASNEWVIQGAIS